tara:strand:+ start:315 stop:599 length:285 start_codon:yes stop_codon:yes gene_type:complete
MSKDFIFDNAGFFVVDNTSSEDFVPISCEVCGFFMRNSSDALAYREHQCCFECAMTYAEPNREKWKKGWRPRKKDIKEDLELRSKLTPKITFEK